MKKLIEALRAQYPYGHPRFLPISIEEVALHSDKNHDYAKGGTPLGNFERVGAILALYPQLVPSDPKVLTLIYMLKQLDAVLWGFNQHIEHKVEGALPRLGDISVYAKIAMCMVKDEMTKACHTSSTQDRGIRLSELKAEREQLVKQFDALGRKPCAWTFPRAPKKSTPRARRKR